MCVTNSSLLLVRLSIPPLACVIGVERGRGSGTVGDRDLGEGCLEGPQWVFRDPCGFAALRYVFLKFPRVNLFL